MMYVIFGLFSLTTLVFGSNRDWNGLRVTWSLNPFNSWGFESMPRNLNSKTPDFVLRDDSCKIAGSKFLGQRYWHKQDPGLTLLYDKKGTIAGVQTSIPKNSNFTPSAQLANRYYIEDGDYWTLTAYFVEPSSICTIGRSTDELVSEGTGTGLWLQEGPNPAKDSVKIPLAEEEVKKSSWKFGQCFWTMGNHYWYNVTQGMDCGHFVPYCLMYNKGKLSAFCFSINANLSSQRYEHPTADIANKFIDPVPDCFFKDPSYKISSTIHVYLIDNPRTASWC